MPCDVFISYRRVEPDASWVRESLAPALRNAGLSVSLDNNTFVPGEQVVAEVQRTLPESQFVLCVVSPDLFEGGGVTLLEAAGATLLREGGASSKLVPFIYRNSAKMPDWMRPLVPVDWTEPAARNREWRRLLKRLSAPHADAPAPDDPGGWPRERINKLNGKLAPAELKGRDAEVERLLKAWNDRNTHLAVLIGPAGSGKTALVWELIQRLRKPADETIPRPDAIYGWSFANQGHDDFRTTAIRFADAAVNFLGGPDPTRTAFQRLAFLLRQSRCLLVIDGMETQQEEDGELRQFENEEGLRFLIQDILKEGLPAGGLVLITSKLSSPDFQHYTIPIIELEGLTPAAGAELLRALRIHGPQEELERAIVELGGNSLFIVLLAGFLWETGRSIFQRGDFDLPAQGPYQEWVEKTVSAYVALLYPHERKFLQLLGLFGRPMKVDELRELRQCPGRRAACVRFLRHLPPGITEQRMYARLCRLHLLADPVPGQSWIKWDTHPLIRQHFAEEFRGRYTRCWRNAHSILFDYYCQLDDGAAGPAGKKVIVDRLAAVRHGCLARRYRDAYELYKSRIAYDFRGYDTEDLSLAPETLLSLSAFFDKSDSTYETPTELLTKCQQAWILTRVSYCFESLGELHRATWPRQVSNRLYRELHAAAQSEKERCETARDGAYGCEVLSMIQLRLGDLPNAVATAAAAVTLAQHCFASEPNAKRDVRWCPEYCLKSSSPAIPAWLRVCSTRAAYGSALHKMGRSQEAEAQFREAVRMHDTMCRASNTCENCGLVSTGHCESENHFSLHSEPGVWYCTFRLDRAADRQTVDDIRTCIARMIAWSNRDATQATESTKGLHLMVHGLAAIVSWELSGQERQRGNRVELVDAAQHLLEASIIMTNAKKPLFLCDVLLHKAQAHRHLGQLRDAFADADKVIEIAGRHRMKLSHIDALLLKGNLQLDESPKNAAAARAVCEEVNGAIDDTGYELRRPSAALLEARVAHFATGNADLELRRAKTALLRVHLPRLELISARYAGGDWNC